MTLEEKQQSIIEEFSIFDDWQDKYQYIIDLGKELPKLDENKKTDDNIIQGCQSLVWLDSEFENGVMKYSADSEGNIPKGIISLLISVLNEEKPEDIVKADLHFIKDIELQEHLMPTRSNGLASMVKKMKMAALKNCK